MLALIIWEHDRPITGNIIKLENIVTPRKAIGDYREGERVSARCKGFGVPDGVIGKIAEDSQRKELEDILRGNGFEALVKKVVDSSEDDVVRQETLVTPVVEHQEEDESRTVEQIKLQRPKARKPARGKITVEKKKNEDALRKATEAAAAELELTELHRDVELHLLENDASLETSTTSSHLKRGLDSLIEDMELENEQYHKVSKTDSDREPHCTCGNRTERLEQEVWHLNQKVLHQESNIAWLWNQVQQLQQTQANLPASGTSSIETAPSGTVAPSQVSASFEAPEGNTNPSNRNEEEETVGGFTDSQLEWKSCHCTTYSKMGAVLFRTLFKEEEYLGHSLSGGGNKPQVDQVKMQAIYRVVAKKFKEVTPVMIREKLRDLVKPCRVKNRMYFDLVTKQFQKIQVKKITAEY